MTATPKMSEPIQGFDETVQPAGRATLSEVDDRVYTLEDVRRRALVTDKTALYIAGPMTGKPQFNYPAFDQLEAILEDKGYVIASPARLDDAETRRVALQSEDGAPGSGTTNGETWGDFLARDVKAIADIVDGVVLMPGWQHSSGARLEAFICRHVGKPVFYATPTGEEAYLSDAHDAICMCPEVGDEYGPWYDVDFVELDDAELDHVLAQADYDTLAKIDRDAGRPELKAGPAVKVTEIEEPGETDYEPGKEVRVVDAKTGGEKGSKMARFDLIPAEAMRQLALVYGGGAQKYEDNNWRKGYAWGLSVAALQRHLNAWLQGEDNDPEVSDLAGEPVSHLANVMWHCCTLITFLNEGLGTNDIIDRKDHE